MQSVKAYPLAFLDVLRLLGNFAAKEWDNYAYDVVLWNQFKVAYLLVLALDLIW